MRGWTHQAQRFKPWFIALWWGTVLFAPEVNAQAPSPEEVANPAGTFGPTGALPWLSEGKPFSADAARGVPQMPPGQPSLGFAISTPGRSMANTPDPLSVAGGAPPSPFSGIGWPKDPALALSLAGPVFLYGQVRRDDWALSQHSRMFGQAGVGWKMPVGEAAEVLFRCGPEMAYADPLRPDYGPDRQPLSYRPQWLRLEVLGRWPLLGPIGLECEGAVCPAIDPGEHDAIDRDLRLVFPVGRGGQWQLGTRRRWETGSDTKTGTDDRLLYGGFRFAW